MSADHGTWEDETWDGYDNYHDMDARARLQFAHDIGSDRLIECWSNLTYTLDWDDHILTYLQIDYTNAYCAIGCCRMLSGGFRLAFMLKAKAVHVLGIKSSGEEEEYICGSRIYSNAASGYSEDLNNEEMIKRHGIVCNPSEDIWAKWKKHDGSELGLRSRTTGPWACNGASQVEEPWLCFERSHCEKWQHVYP
ncbi:hypothetical protein M3J09_011693 [Ascochyta lentis]